MLLRDRSTTQDPRLDRLVQFDPRSRAFPVAEVVGEEKKLRGYHWRIEDRFRLNQGREGACGGFSGAQELAAKPLPDPQDGERFARWLYHQAQLIDPWPGGAYPGAVPFMEGTSILAVMQVLHKLGAFDSYRWGFGIKDALYGIAYTGPGIFGIPWYEGMYQRDSDGVVRPTGDLMGYHAIIGNQVIVKKQLVRLPNTWGDGDYFISWDDLERLLHEQGEVAFPIRRKKLRPQDGV